MICPKKSVMSDGPCFICLNYSFHAAGGEKP